MRNSIAIEDRREGSLPNNRPLLPTTVSVIIPRLFWKGIKCCTRLAYLEVIFVPLRLIQLDEVGRDIHDQRLGACATLVYRQRHTPPGISLQSCTWYYPMYWVCKACPSTASQAAQTLCTHQIWMWGAVNGGLQSQPWQHCNIIQARPYPVSPKIHPHLYNVLKA